ncbi:MAG: YlxR family protein [Vampirovibrionales bacterium]
MVGAIAHKPHEPSSLEAKSLPHHATRQCLVCRQHFPQSRLVRLILQKVSEVKGNPLPHVWHVLMPMQDASKQPIARHGRSVYWCDTPTCWQALSKKQGKGLSRFFPITWSAQTRQELWETLARLASLSK